MQHQPNRCEVEHQLRRLDTIFVILAEPTVSTQPSEAPLHNPSQPGDLEGTLPPFDDLQFPTITPHKFASQLTAFMPSIGNNCMDPWEQRSQTIQQASPGASVRHVS